MVTFVPFYIIMVYIYIAVEVTEDVDLLSFNIVVSIANDVSRIGWLILVATYS